eukprot:NODE_1441_length_914_cov_128.846243_g1112_i0.p1 GENE.NODE_1441_length_914_cov_128.846243_g1112_i0~~NODE_1441_length_914_cov_128.846243_g1112_i0.p1  ORF type:complete len:247 (-),score=52.60 NODE_1441_length_914_cov_128.846243_g1112_i0:88-828(-)
MEAITELLALLQDKKKPSSVDDLEQLRQWLKELPLDDWACAFEEEIFSKKEQVKEKQEEVPKVEDAKPPAPKADTPPPVKIPPKSDCALIESTTADDPVLHEEWEKVRRNEDPQNWLLLGLNTAASPRGKAPLVDVVGRGTGGRAEMVPLLNENRIMFGGFKVRAIDERGGVTSDRAKFVFVQWVGEAVPAMAKARIAMQRSDFDKIFAGAHLTLQASDESELAQDSITAKLHANGGAHSPNRYEY